MSVSFQKWALAIGIAIIFNLFINYGIATFKPGPEYNDFCRDSGPRSVPFPAKEPADCFSVAASDEMQQSCSEQKGYVAYHYNASGCPSEAYCETCQTEWDNARKTYNGFVFIVLVVLGAIAIAAGLFLKVESISTGFLLGGILSVVIGALRAWDQLQDVVRFVLLGIVLAALIWLGYKKVNK